MEERASELEKFREQWRAEVSAATLKSSVTLPLRSPNSASHFLDQPSRSKLKDVKEEKERVKVEPYDVAEGYAVENVYQNEPKSRSALEHYELAVEKEDEGCLGESLYLYRKAFRMDYRVDRVYKDKYFPSHSADNKPKFSSNGPAVEQNLETLKESSTEQLIASFSDQPIIPVSSTTEDKPQCRIAEVPDEILVRILTELAIYDVSSFSKTAMVCKRLAFLVKTEESIWKRVCLGSEVGFGAMHYEWQTGVHGDPLDTVQSSLNNPSWAGCPRRDSITMILHRAYSSSWYQMFRLRPRIRFGGCYISTVNYIRPGEATPSQVSWNSPVHMVTYYRYLRFFRDGTVISLLTTVEPKNAVYFLTKELQEVHRNGAASHLPSSFMQKALRGRWHLLCDYSKLHSETSLVEGDVQIETEGVNAKYIYHMKLSLRSVGKRSNNKLIWQRFWSYNTLNEDLSEFNIAKDKPFFWSRVKSYGGNA
ncbi:hypothetical protein K3495_g4747 [Podosphaera aphanis]|nr:hypothetical protein K3495_g4747 [Podosphaera aphanis]